MILVLVLAYLAVLFLLVKLKLIKLTLFWKLSPVIWIIFLLIAIFIPLQFWAPSGFAWSVKPTTQVVPNVAGQVTAIYVEGNQRVKKGDLLFKIDDTLFKSAVDQLNARLTLDKIQLEQQQQLVKKKLGKQADLDRAKANYLATKAQLSGAMYSLEQSSVRATSDGIITNVEALHIGARVVTAPLRQAMLLVDDSKTIVLAQVQQIYLRNIEVGQNAELTFKKFPNQIFTAKVEYIAAGSALGQFSPTGNLPTAVPESHGPMWVRLTLDDSNVGSRLPAGATGSVAIYSPKGKPAQIIRKVAIRLESIMNYIVPF